MNLRHAAQWVLIATSLSTLHAQTASQDIKNAGSHTKAAAQSAGNGVSKGTKKTYRSTKRGTKNAFHKTQNQVNGNR